MLLAASGFAVASLAQSDLLVLTGLTFAVVGLLAANGPFFSLLSSFLGGTAAAGGIALVIAIANRGGFLGPYFIDVVKEQTGGYAASMAALALAVVAAAAIALALGGAMTRNRVQLS